VRTRARLAWASAGTAVLVLAMGALAHTHVLDLTGGLLAVAGACLGLSLLPFWGRTFAPLPRMTDLNRRPRQDERWCAACGRPARRGAACAACGDPGRGKRGRGDGLHRKQRVGRQEREP